MSEQAPQSNPAQEAMMQQIDAAHQATEEAGTLSVMELGQAKPTINTIESMGDVVNGPFVQVDTHANNEGGQPGEVLEQTVRANANKIDYVDGKGVGSEYEVTARDNDISPSRVDVRRTDARGETYTHSFRNPDTARKFGTLIAKQVTERAEAKSERKAA